MNDQLQPIGEYEGIRKHIDESGTIWYAVVDVIEVLVESSNPGRYWSDMRNRREDGAELYAICVEFPMKHKKNGRTYKTDCANQEGLLRIIQSIPSPKAEPFKQWLAMTGSRRLDEIKADPIEAMRERLRLSGLDEAAINRRLEAFKSNRKLLGEWSNRGVDDEGRETLSDVVHKGTFDGMTRNDHANLKQLPDGEVLSDHMNDLEIAFSILGDASTLEEIKYTNPKGLKENEIAG